MKKIIMVSVLALMALTFAGCGNSTATQQEVSYDKTSTAEIKSTAMGLTLTTPEDGWNIEQDDSSNFIISNGNCSVMCMQGESDAVIMPSSEEELKTMLGGDTTVSDFEVKDADGEKSVSYTTTTGTGNDSTTMINNTKVTGDKYLSVIATVTNGTEERIAQMKQTVESVK